MKTRKIRLNRLILSLFRHPKQMFSAALIAALILMGSAAPQTQAAVGTLVTAPLTVPEGTLWLPGNLGGHLWISDHLLGFCRLDPTPTLGGPLTINPATCAGALVAAKAPGQPSFHPATNSIYLPDIAAARGGPGVWRLTFDPVTETVLGTPPVGLVPLDPLVNDKPAGSAVDAAGNLYLSFFTVGQIKRITGPSVGTGTAVELVGNEPGGAGGRGSSLAFVGPDLYVAGSLNTGKLTAAAGCGGLNPICAATSVASTVTVPLSVAANGTLLYIGNASAVWRFETTTPATPAVLFSNGGTALLGGPVIPFQNVSGLGFDGALNLYLGDDPTAGLTALQGRLWQIAAGALPGAAATGMVTGPRLSTNLTVPHGTVWMPGALGGHFWISDHILGFCRLDPGLIPGTLVINAATCMGPLQAATAPGQPTYDPATQSVYLPDVAAARQHAGVWRLTFDPATETVGSPTPVAALDPFYLDKPVGSALGPDGKLYISFLKNGLVHRITTPSGLSQTVENVSTDFQGRVSSLAFVGNDLYLAGGINVGKIANVAACTGTCGATSVAAGVITAPLSLAYDGFRYLYIGNSASIYRHAVATNTTTLYSNSGLVGAPPVSTPFQLISGLGFGPTGILYAGDDPSAGLVPLQGHLWEVEPYVLAIHDAKSGKVSTTVNYTLDITNTVTFDPVANPTGTDTLNLTYTGNAWATTGPASVGPLVFGASQPITVAVTVPTGLTPVNDSVVVTATAASSGAKSTSGVLTTTKILFDIFMPLIIR